MDLPARAKHADRLAARSGAGRPAVGESRLAAESGAQGWSQEMKPRVGQAMLIGLAAILGAASGWQSLPTSSGETSDTPAKLREPVALVLVDEGKRLIVANRHCGSISVIDTETGKVV